MEYFVEKENFMTSIQKYTDLSFKWECW